MYVSKLPIEVWAIIIQKLDTKSLCNLYESCSYLRNIICMYGVIKECNFSLTTLATVKSLKLEYLRQISGCLKVLNLCGVSDLNKSCLIPALKRLKNLIELDVSYTNIIMPDVADIVKASPTLKNLAINFKFGKICNATKKWIVYYQEAFEQFENIHFVGSTTDLLYWTLAVDILKKANLSSLDLTVCTNDCCFRNYEDEDSIDVKSNLPQFKVYFINEISKKNSLIDLPVLKKFELSKFEIVVFETNTVHATPMLKEFICRNYNINVTSMSHLPPVVTGEAVLMLWKTDTTIFDSEFYSKFSLILKENLIFNFDSSNLTPVPANYKWCSVDQLFVDVNRNDDVKEIMFKKARIAQPNFVLNYDEALKQKEDIKLRINFKEYIPRPVTIKTSGYLKKLKHLSLYGEVQFSPDFFKILFEYCDSLVTLEIVRSKGTIAIPKLLQFLSNSKRLKNILLSVSELLGQLFKYLSECKTLENIYLMNPTMVFETLPNPSDVFRNCDNLYSMCVQSNSPELIKMLRMYKKVRTELGKDGLHIDMFPNRSEKLTSHYSPYFSVFSINKYKPLAFVST